MRRAVRTAWRTLRFATLMLGVAVVEGVLEAIAKEYALSRRSKRLNGVRAYDEYGSRR